MVAATFLLSLNAGTHRDDLLKPSVIAALTLVAVLLTFYSFQHDLGDFLLVLYLLPLVLASIWYPRYGLVLIGIVVVGAGVTIFYTTWSGLSPNPLRYLLYTAIFVWIIAVITVFTMEGRASLDKTLKSLRSFHMDSLGQPAGESLITGTAERPHLSNTDLTYLIEALATPDPAAREVAIRTLGRSGDPRAVQPLIALLGDGHRSTREHTVRALGALGVVAVEPLIQALEDPDWHVRTGAAVALRIIGDERAIEPLIKVLGDGNRFVRREAAKSLGRIGDARVVEPLISALQDRDSGVRGKAILALGRLGDIRARDPLQQLASDPDPDIQLAARDAISKLKN